jgi:hypothetical protein
MRFMRKSRKVRKIGKAELSRTNSKEKSEMMILFKSQSKKKISRKIKIKIMFFITNNKIRKLFNKFKS